MIYYTLLDKNTPAEMDARDFNASCIYIWHELQDAVDYVRQEGMTDKYIGKITFEVEKINIEGMEESEEEDKIFRNINR